MLQWCWHCCLQWTTAQTKQLLTLLAALLLPDLPGQQLHWLCRVKQQ